jgi:hypothetical protein
MHTGEGLEHLLTATDATMTLLQHTLNLPPPLHHARHAEGWKSLPSNAGFGMQPTVGVYDERVFVVTGPVGRQQRWHTSQIYVEGETHVVRMSVLASIRRITAIMSPSSCLYSCVSDKAQCGQHRCCGQRRLAPIGACTSASNNKECICVTHSVAMHVSEPQVVNEEVPP